MKQNNEKAINQLVRRSVPVTDLCVEQRAEGEEPSRRISGYAVRFNEWSKPFWDEWVEMIDPQAFVGCDMSDVRMCTDHGTDCVDVLARYRDGAGTLSIEIDAVGVKFSFDAPTTTRGNDILELVRRGDINECSFAFVVAEDSWSWKRANSSQQYDQRVVKRIAKLYDLSIVIVGKYDNTSAVAERTAVEELRSAANQAAHNILEVAKARDFLASEFENL